MREVHSKYNKKCLRGGESQVIAQGRCSKVQQNPRLQFSGRRGAAMGYGRLVAKIQRMSIVQDDTKSGCNLLRSTLEKAWNLRGK